MDYLVMDIETTPLELKDKVVIEYLMDKQISKEMRSFNPLYSKIICIGLKPKDKDPIILIGGDEVELLEKFWNIAKDYHIFITHNGYGFDIPFLNIRSIINKVKPTVNINLNKFQMLTSNHFDTMLFFSQNGTFTNPRLGIVAKTCSISVPDKGFDGREIERLFKENKLKEIEKHCKEDVEITEKVYNHIMEVIR